MFYLFSPRIWYTIPVHRVLMFFKNKYSMECLKLWNKLGKFTHFSV
jgi:hypothetical protein